MKAHITRFSVTALALFFLASALSAAPSKEWMAAEQEALLQRFQEMRGRISKAIEEKTADDEMLARYRKALEFIASAEIESDMRTVAAWLRSGDKPFELKLKLAEIGVELDRLSEILLGKDEAKPEKNFDPGAGENVPPDLGRVIKGEIEVHEGTVGLAGKLGGKDSPGKPGDNPEKPGENGSDGTGENGENGSSNPKPSENGENGNGGGQPGENGENPGGKSSAERRADLAGRQGKLGEDLAGVMKGVTDPYLLRQLKDAEDKMKEAQTLLEGGGGQPGSGQPGDASGLTDAGNKQKDAIDIMNGVKKTLENRFADIERLKKLFDLKETVTFMLKKQCEINAGTDKFDSTRPATLSRSKIIEVDGIADEQRMLSELATRRGAQVENEDGDIVFGPALRAVGADMDEAAKLLEEHRTDAITRSIQADVAVQLDRILEALEETIKEKEKDLEQSSQPGGGGSKPDKNGKPPVSLAQVKMLKQMQLDINERTKKLAAISASDPGAAAMVKGLCKRLAAREDSIARITKTLIDKLNEK